MKPWQQGFELDELRRKARLFHRQKEYCYGAFGPPKERDIASALAADRWWQLPKGGPADQPEAGAVVAQLRSGSTHRDLAGRECLIHAGDFFVQHLGWLVGAGDAAAELLRRLQALAAARSRTLWWELYQEDTAARALAEMLGFRRQITKVRASSDLRSLWRWNPPGHRPIEDALPPLPIAQEVVLAELREPGFYADRVPAVLEELADYVQLRAAEPEGEAWAQHYSSYNKRQSWQVFTLHGYDDDPDFIIKPEEMSKGWKKENPRKLGQPLRLTSAAPAFPTTLELVASVAEEVGAIGWDRIRFMRLLGGGELTRHADVTDASAGVLKGQVSRLHLPLRAHPAIRVHGWTLDGRERALHFGEAGLYYLDQRKPHRVANPAEEERLDLVMDFFCGAGFSSSLASVFAFGRAL